MSYLTGQQIEQYQVEALLGEGGMGAVYRAFDGQLQRHVALKLMHAQLAQKPAFRHRFAQEAQAVMPFNNPAIINIHHFSAHQDRPYLVMEYAPGGSLSDYLQQLKWSSQPLPLTEALTITTQVAEGLSYAHHRGVIHRDIKPGNILLRRRDGFTGPVEQAIITDFGLAIQTQKESDEDVATNPFMGSLPYMSPEQCANRRLDGRSDIYSLGVMLYRLATGQLPFKIDAPADVIKHLNEDPLPPALLNPDIPEAVEALILKALAKEPDQRYQTGAEVAHAARQALGSVTQEAQQELRANHPVTQWVDEQWIARIDVADRVDVHQTWTSEGQHRLFITHQWEPSQIADLDAEGETATTATIGRAADNDVVLEDGAVSAHHVVLSHDPQEGWLVKDLGSTNGSFLDGNRLPFDEEVIWNQEQTLRIGPYFLKWQAFRTHAGRAAGPATPGMPGGSGDNQPRQETDALHDNNGNGNGQSPGHLPVLAAGAALAPDNTQPAQPGARNGGSDAGAPAPPAPEDVTPEGDGSLALALTPQQIEVEPGGEAVLQLTILNQGVTVEDVHVRVEQQGIVSNWIMMDNGAIKLMPDEAKSVQLRVAPPHGSSIEAGQHPFHVLVTTSRGEQASIDGQVIVARWEDHLLEMHPRNLQEGIDARVSVHNRGNFENRYQLVGIDDADALQFEFDQPRNVTRSDLTEEGLWITVPSEEEARVPFKVGAKKRPWLRAPTIPYPFQVRVRSESSDWETLDGQLSVQPRISRRTLIIFLLLLLGVALLGFLGYRELQARNEAELQRVQATSDAIQATADSLHATREALQSSADTALTEAEAMEATAAAIEAEDPEAAANMRATAAAMREEASEVEATIEALQGELDSTEQQLTQARESTNITPTPPPPPTDITLDNLSIPENSGAGATVGVFSAVTDAQSSNPANGVAARSEPAGDRRFMVLGKEQTTGQLSPPGQSGPRITFSLVSGDGDDNNDAFIIEGATLRTAVDFDYETQNSLNIRVLADNGLGGQFEKPFTIAVEDADDTPTLSISDVEVDEGDGTATLTVEMENDTQSDVSVEYATSNGSARAGSDYEEGEGELTWPAGETGPQTFDITVSDDDLDEDDETFRVDLSSPQNAVINTSSATVTIADDDDPPILAVSNVTVAEGDGDATIVVELDGLSSREVTVNYDTTDGSATEGDDYTGASGTLRWQAGEDGEQEFTISVEDDDINEEDETVRVSLTSPANAIIDQGSGTVTVTDNDDPPTLAIEDTGPVQEGGEAAITVRMTGRSSSPVSVEYTTADGTARAGADYQTTSGTLAWAPGDTGAQFIQVPVTTDQIFESPDETFQVTLSNPDGATIEQESATFTITDDDERPNLEIVDTTVNEADDVAVVTVRLRGASSTAITADYASGGGDASAGADYEAAASPPPLTWLPEEEDATREIQITILDVEIDEGDGEQFEVSLSVSGDNVTIRDGVARVTIVDDDEAGFNTSPGSLTVTEGGDEGTFTIRLLSEPMADVTVPISANSQCIVAEEAVLNANNWRSGVQVAVSADDDDIDDDDQNCSLTLGNPSSDDEHYGGLSASDVGTVTVIAADDDQAGVTVNPLSLTVSEPDGTVPFHIVLDSEPLATVTIPLRSLDTGECEVLPSVQIDPQDWNTGVEVQVLAVDDDVDDDQQTCIVETEGPQSSGDSKYDAFRGTDVEDVSVTVEDDDEAGVVVMPTALTISETDGADTATVAISLTSRPEARVTVPIAVGPGSDGHVQCDVDPDSVSIRPQDWPELLEFTVTAIDDRRNDGDQDCPLSLGPADAAAPGDNNYDGMPVDNVGVTVQDDDEPGVLIVQSGNDTGVEEGGDGDNYTIELVTEPSDDVTVTINPDPQLSVDGDADTGQAIGDTYTFEFDALNWDDEVTINVEAHDDNFDEDQQHSAVITHTVSSSDLDYDGSGAIYFPSNTVPVTITDNDVAGVSIGEVGGDIEEGDSGTYTITLDTHPLQPVDVIADPPDDLDLGSGFGEPHTVTIAPADWNTPQTIAVTVQDDQIYEPNHEDLEITHSSNSADPKYQGLSLDSTSISVQDDDDPPVLETSAITVTEQANNFQATMTVTPNGATTVPITVTYSTADGTAEAGAGKDYNGVTDGTLVWDAGDSSAQDLEITIRADDIDEGDSEHFFVDFTNLKNADMSPTQYRVTIEDDDDPPQITFDNPSFPEGDNNHDDHAVTLELEGRSSQTVEVCYTTEDDTAKAPADYKDINATPEQCVEWQPEQGGARTFDVRIYGDTDDEGLFEQFFVNLQLQDANTATLDDNQITVTIEDDDAGTVNVSTTTVNALEGSTTASSFYTLALANQPSAGVTYTITPSAQLDLGEGPGAPLSVDIAPQDWNQPYTVVVQGVDDDVAQGSRQGTITHSAVSSDGNFSETLDFSPSEVVNVDIEDDDNAGVTVAPQILSIFEGNDDTYSLQLQSEPTDTVQVTAASTEQLDLGDGPGVPTTVTFTPQNWSTAQQISVEAVADDLYEGGAHTALITHTVSSNDPGYDDLNVSDVEVTVDDADLQPTLSADNVNVSEGDGEATIVVEISTASIFPVTVNYTTFPLFSADPSSDYETTSGTLNWSPGDDTPKSFTVSITDDDDVEVDEFFFINFTGASGATMITPQIVVFIEDNDSSSGALPPSGDSQMVQEEHAPVPPNRGGLAILLGVVALAVPLGRRRRWLALVLVLGLGLLTHRSALAVEPSDRWFYAQPGPLQPVVDHVEPNAGASALDLDIYFTLQGTAPPPEELESAEFLLEDGSRHEARVEKPPFYVALMMDTSGSMNGTMDVMRQSATDLIEASPPETSFAVIEFNESIRLVQPFTADRQQARAAVDSLEISDAGTCLYDAARTAVQSLEQLARDAPRRALVLFSDGRDESTAAGPCSENTLDQLTALSAERSVPVPIHTVALSGGGFPNTTDLQRIADASAGQMVTRDGLPDFTAQLADDIRRQWLARVQTYPEQQGYQRGALLLDTAGTGRLPPASVAFQAQRSYDGPPSPDPIVIRDFSYNEVTDRFLFDVALAEPQQVSSLDVTVTDARSNVQALQKTQDVILPTEQISLEAADLQPERRYEVRVVPLASDGEALTDGSGRPLVAEHRFLYELPPGANQLQFQIEDLRIKDEPPLFDLRSFRMLDDQAELIVSLDLANANDLQNLSTADDSVQQVEGYITNQEGDLQLGEFVGELQPNHTVRTPLNLQQGQYRLTLRALDEEGAPLATAESAFSYRPRLTVLQRAGRALRQNSVLLPLAFAPLVVGLVAGWFVGRAVGRRQGRRAALDAAPVAAPAPAPTERPIEVVLRVTQTPDPALMNTGSLRLDKTPFTIGREGSDLTIANDLHVSRRHARITHEDDRYYLEDLGSSNGTFVDDARLVPHEPTLLNIQGESLICIGKTTELTIKGQEVESPPQQTDADDAVAGDGLPAEPPDTAPVDSVEVA